ncbi:MAG: MBL fold metallo-hydrolase [Phycisphaerae bacterium]|nr:MBL fold metallo-hydrolase [Phycisphaerae bacterium]
MLRAIALAALLLPTAVLGQSVRLRALGTAQDGGIPHAACACPRCDAARADPSRRRLVASLGLVVSGEGSASKVFLIDATPDLRAQLDMLADVRDAPADRVDRAPVDGVLLTHAHVGHYAGLMFFGYEAVSTRDLPVWGTPKMIAFLRANEPWAQLVRIRNIEPREAPPGVAFEPAPGVTVTPIRVPHRDELSDTVGFRITGPARTALYIPDTEPWRNWREPFPDPITLFEGVDVAILDATFYSPGELPGRNIAAIGHPLMTETMDLLESRVRAGALTVYFTHLNHSNPVLDPAGEEARAVESRGFMILRDGQEIPL